MIHAVSFGSQQQAQQEKKFPAVATVVGLGAGAGAGYFLKDPKYKDADSFLNSSEAEGDLKNVTSNDDNKSHIEKLQNALKAGKDSDEKNKKTIETLFSGDKKEVALADVLKEAEGKPSVDDLKAVLADKAEETMAKTHEDELAEVKKAAEALEKGKDNSVGDNIKIYKDSEGKVTVERGKKDGATQASKTFKMDEGEKIQKLTVASDELSVADHTAIDKIAKEKLVDKTEAVDKVGDKFVQVKKSADGKSVTYQFGTMESKFVINESKENSLTKVTKTLDEINKADATDPKLKKIQEATKSLTEKEPKLVDISETETVRLSKKGEEVTLEYGTAKKEFAPIANSSAKELKAPVVLDEIQQKVKDASAGMKKGDAPKTIPHKDGKVIQITHDDKGIAYAIGKETEVPGTSGTFKAEYKKSLDDFAKESVEKRAAFDKKKALADALGITKDATPEKITKESAEKALKAASSEAGKIKEAFEGLKGALPKKISGMKIGICAAAGGALAAIMGYALSGNKE